MIFTKQDSPKTFPLNTNNYIFDIMNDDIHYPPHLTEVEIYPDGGLGIMVKHHIESKYYDDALDPNTKIICKDCGSKVKNLSWLRHLDSKVHKKSTR